MDLQIKDKKALVSASSQGIGFAIAKTLAAEGAQLIINGRNEAKLVAAKEKILSEYPQAQVEYISADLSTSKGCDQLTVEHPHIDILVNALGIFEPKDFMDIPDEDWERFFNVNVLSGVRLSRAYLPYMREKNWETCAGTGITVNAVLPGPTRSEGVVEFVDQVSGGQEFEAFEKEFFQSMRPSSLIKRFADTQEVANMVTYLCSPLASATTGASVRVDGGVVKSCV